MVRTVLPSCAGRLHVFENTLNKGDRTGQISLASRPHSRDEWSCKGKPMANYPYLLFNQSPEQLRRIGARGGKAQARNRRERLQAQTQAQPQTVAVIDLRTQTAAEAIMVLDAQFPWLCGAEKRMPPR